MLALYYVPKSIPCCLSGSRTPCCSYSSWLTYDPNRKIPVSGYEIREYDLIKSRCPHFGYTPTICPIQRYELCEGYRPERCCSVNYCQNKVGLTQMDVSMSLFVGFVPICGYICSWHKEYYERLMNEVKKLSIENSVASKPTYLTGYDIVDTSRSTTTVNQRSHDDVYLDINSAKDTAKSIVTPVDIHNVPENTEVRDARTRTNAPQDTGLNVPDAHSDEKDQSSNTFALQNDIHILEESETNQKTRHSKTSDSPKSSTESMETQRLIRINVCASPSTSLEWQHIDVLDKDTFAALKAKIADLFGFEDRSDNFYLLYSKSAAQDSRWIILEIEDETRFLGDLSFDNIFIKICNIYPLPGLENLGNTCYMNSALQCLNHIQPFFNYFRGINIKAILCPEKVRKETISPLIQLYSNLVDFLCSPHDGCVWPAEFHNKFGELTPRFFNYHQHDSLEFLNIFLDILHEDLMTISEENRTIVSKTFHGQLQTVVTCKRCEKKVETDDSFSFLPLPIPEGDMKRNSSHSRYYKLDECFKALLQGERIGDHGQWYCEHCAQLTDAKKTLYLKELPRVLILQLKRFNYDLRSYAKNETLIEYDLDNLDINEYVIESHRNPTIRYDLVAVSNHWGNLIGGHYATYAKLPRTKDWYMYDDSRVGRRQNGDHRNNFSAYILFYQRQENSSTIGTAV